MSGRAPSKTTAWVLASLPLLVVVAANYAAFGGEIGVAAFWNIWRDNHPEALRLVKLYTDWGNPALYLVYAGLLLRGLAQKRRDATAFVLAYLAAQILVSVAIERVLKISIGRPRPGVAGPFVPWSLDSVHNSLPSGHTEEMALQTAPLALRAQGWPAALGWGLVLGLMGLSRIVLGAHHPSDVLAGLVVGGLGALFITRLAPRLSTYMAARLPKTWSA